ncbi:MAG: Gfo/Idh/MocA family oxidoreductase [Bacteroidota bacterium]
MNQPFRWGILAPGKIAAKFAAGMLTVPQAQLYAVASRSAERAQAFATEFDIPQVYDSYEALLQDPQVDAVYVAPPHSFHHKLTLLALEHGKPVLCEKPLAINAGQVEEMLIKAAKKNLFLMEAVWTRFLPVWVQIRKWLAEDKIGEVRMLSADFSFRSSTWDLSDRKFNPDLAGGALLDVGIYPVQLACMLFGDEPVDVQSTAYPAATGTDMTSAYLLRYAGGEIAALSSSFEVNGTKEAILVGTKGRIRVPLFWRADRAILESDENEPEVIEFPFEASGLQYQAVHMMECMAQGLTESPIMSHANSRALIRLMDQMRGQWGLKYPGE